MLHEAKLCFVSLIIFFFQASILQLLSLADAHALYRSWSWRDWLPIYTLGLVVKHLRSRSRTPASELIIFANLRRNQGSAFRSHSSRLHFAEGYMHASHWQLKRKHKNHFAQCVMPQFYAGELQRFQGRAQKTKLLITVHFSSISRFAVKCGKATITDDLKSKTAYGGFVSSQPPHAQRKGGISDWAGAAFCRAFAASYSMPIKTPHSQHKIFSIASNKTRKRKKIPFFDSVSSCTCQSSTYRREFRCNLEFNNKSVCLLTTWRLKAQSKTQGAGYNAHS